MNIQQGLIFEKTPQGEDEVRTRGLQLDRNARLVLILIDGQISAAELIEKLPGTDNVPAYIASLWRDGLIAPAGSFGPIDESPVLAPTSVHEEGAAHELTASAILEERVEPSFLVARPMVDTSKPITSSQHPSFGSYKPINTSKIDSQFPAFEPAPKPIKKEKPKLTIPTISVRRLFKPLIISGGAIVAVSVLGVIGMQFVTLPLHPTAINHHLNAVCGEAPSYQGVRLQLLPSVNIKAEGLTAAGACPAMSELGVGTSLSGLWAEDTELTSLSVSGVEVQSAQLMDLLEGLHVSYPATLPVDFSNIKIGTSVGEMAGLFGSGSIENGRLTKLNLSDSDKTVQVELNRSPVGYQFNWAAPQMSIGGIVVNNADVSGLWAKQGVVIEKLTAVLDGGKISGSARISQSPDMLSANLGIKGVPSRTSLFKSLQLISDADVSGNLQMQLGLNATEPLLKRMALTGQMRMTNGSLSGADLLDVAQSDQKMFQASGRTLFLSLSTQLSLSDGKWNLSNLSLIGAAVEANGALVADGEKITGNLSIASSKLHLPNSGWQVNGIPGAWKFIRHGGVKLPVSTVDTSKASTEVADTVTDTDQ
ncbi:hypothetical protein LIN78_09575 [Leeia sp. TBRC 13508]|uniref:AsmA-like C-terminal domain-containing protein n=1 Tax=Leeia speluncae TaxID=2884804 RepID=A0ABS8D6G7_9NEIS|nr:AsmA-like C-terminal region-containing protein [Leeia speluncae]MCB6183794.1 hypothetical protein [Leeia speluncae]